MKKTIIVIAIVLLCISQSQARMNLTVVGGGVPAAAPEEDYSGITLFWRCEALQMAAGDTYQSGDSLWEVGSLAAINTDAAKTGTNGLDIPTSGDSAGLTNTNDYFTSTGSGRIAFWIRVVSWGDGAGVFDLNLTGANGMWLRMSETDGELSVNWTGDSEQVTFSTSGAGLDPNEWHFVEFKFDDPNNALEVLVDNVSVGSSSSAMTSWAATGGNITIGDTQAVTVDYHIDLVIFSTDATQSLYGLRNNTAAP